MTDRTLQTTDGAAPHERWDFWADMTLDAVDAAPSGETLAFAATRSIAQTSYGTLIETAGAPLPRHRPRAGIPQDGSDHACFVLVMTGCGVVDEAARAEVRVEAGGMVLYDLGRLNMAAPPSHDRELRLCVPRGVFAARIGSPESLAGLQFGNDAGLLELFKVYLTDYAAALPTLSTQEAEIGMDGMLHLLSGLVERTVDGKREGRGELVGATLVALARRQIQASLADPNFNVAMLARAVGVSRTKLYKAFADEGGIAAVIRDARLDRARQQLATPANRRRTIEEIANGCGFTDSSTFSRAFRRRFAITPRDWQSSRGRRGRTSEAGTSDATKPISRGSRIVHRGLVARAEDDLSAG